ncbi:MAG: hydroxymethylglutaryl-CoA lyase [Castellaniella sp.]
MDFPRSVKIVEVSPRDGLQNEKVSIPVNTKITLVDRLSAAGFVNIEAVSFVSPKWVPQMADGAEVMAGIQRRPGTIYSALTPNMKGFEAARAAGMDEVVIFAAASETFSRKNINCSIAESVARFEPVAQAAKDAGIRLRASVSCALDCPYEGPTPVEAVADLVKRMLALGCDEIDIADTIGTGTPSRVHRVMKTVTELADPAIFSGHFHDTYGQALANILASMQAGISIFHSSAAGLGGCPYAKGATGNVATEDVLYMMQGMGVETGIDLDAVVDIGQWIAGELGRRPDSRAGNALAARKA